MATAQAPNRGEVWLVDFHPSVGAEIQKLRPAVVVSADAIGRLPLRVVVPITDWKPAFAGLPWFVRIAADAQSGLVKDSGADAFQVKSISLRRFGRRLGACDPELVDAVASAVALCVAAP